MKYAIRFFFLAVALGIFTYGIFSYVAPRANADFATSTSFRLRQVITSGGEQSTSTTFRERSSIGQQGTGISSSTSFILKGGFLYFGSAPTTPSSPPSSPPPSPPSPPGGGSSNSGGGGGGGAPPVVTQVVFRGIAYPGSNITLLKDAQVVARVPAGPDAKFKISVSGLSGGTYIFGVWAEDTGGDRSITHTFTIAVTTGVSTDVSGIFIPPTIATDKIEVKRGDIITILGQSAPQAQISLAINSDNEIVKKTAAGEDGTWLYKFDTLEVDYGNHSAKSRAAKDGDITTFSKLANFKVGTKNVFAAAPQKVSKSDLNGDGKVNLVDFSMLVYWHKRPSPPVKMDLNGDGKVDLIDFSILAYYWTG